MSIDLDALLNKFARAETAAQLQEYADALIKGKLVNSARLDERFKEGIERCLGLIGGPHDVLMVLSLLYHLAATSKPVKALIKQGMRGRLTEPLPPLSLLESGKNRFYAALALGDASGGWLDTYLAKAIAEEDSAELARCELARQLLSRKPLGDALRLIAAAMSEVRYETIKPGESAAKRLRRVCQSLRPTIVRDSITPGDGLGGALRELFQAPARAGGVTPGDKAGKDAAEEAFALVGDILRTQLTVLADPEIYLSLQPVTHLVDPRMWPRFVAKSRHARGVLQALRDALVLLAKQGVTDQRLLHTLEFLTGSRDAAAAETARIAMQTPGLEEPVADWLRRFGRSRSAPVLTSLASPAADDGDVYIASLLLLITPWIAAESGTSATDPQERVALEVQRLARARRLAVRHSPGDCIDYLPASHELLGGHRLGVRRVRVVQPLVERVGAGGASVVVQKAIVEEWQESRDAE